MRMYRTFSFAVRNSASSRFASPEAASALARRPRGPLPGCGLPRFFFSLPPKRHGWLRGSPMPCGLRFRAGRIPTSKSHICPPGLETVAGRVQRAHIPLQTIALLLGQLLCRLVRSATWPFAQHACSAMCRRQSTSLEPLAAIRDPPAQCENRDRCSQSPPQRKNKVGKQPERCERQPEDLSFHNGLRKQVDSDHLPIK